MNARVNFAQTSIVPSTPDAEWSQIGANSPITADVQKKFDAAKVRLANAYTLPQGGPMNMLTAVRQIEINGATESLNVLDQDFPELTQAASNKAALPEVQKTYEGLLARLADADAMPTGGFAIFANMFTQLRDDVRAKVKQEIADFLAANPELNKSQAPVTNAKTNTAPAAASTEPLALVVPTATSAPATVAPVAPVAPTSTAAAEATPIDAATVEQAKNASGVLGAYMHANNVDVIDVNKLSAIANNVDGRVPKDVQDAAAFMLKNPKVYEAIETHDVAGADGISARVNFDMAAQGLVSFDEPAASATNSATAATAEQTLAQQAKNASGVLAAFMRANNIYALNMNDLYSMAYNTRDKTPEDVKKAASFMLKNPQVYRAIETNDVAGVDGISGLSNFENMAMGNIAMDKSITGASDTSKDANVAQPTKTAANTPAAALNLSTNQQTTPTPGTTPAAASKVNVAQETKVTTGTPTPPSATVPQATTPAVVAPAPAAAAAPTDAQLAKNAAGALAAYARTNGIKLVDPNMLYKLTINAGGKVSKDVQKAASFLLTHPDIFKAIETSIWDKVDGLASLDDLEKATQGLTKLA